MLDALEETDLASEALTSKVAHLWTANIGPEGANIEVAWEFLSKDEQDRANRRFRFKRDRDRFIRTRWLLRSILGQYLEFPPEQIAIGIHRTGKPFLLSHANLHFNLSHSDDFAVLAFSVCRDIGVDVEVIDPELPCLEVASCHFTDSEYQALRASEAGSRSELFHRIWTAKEALMKAAGTGLSVEPNRIHVRLGANGLPCGYEGIETDQIDGAWHLDQFMPNSNTVISFAAPSPLTILHRTDANL